MSFDILDSVFESGYAYTVEPSSFAEELINERGALGTILAAALPILQYYIHGLLEFQILWANSNIQTFSGGALLFGPYVKFFSLLGLIYEPDLFILFPRVGIFTSFWGPLWVDFGWFALFAMFLFGFLARMLARACRVGDLGAIPLYSYFCAILFFMPVVNFAISAQGMYVINAFVVFWFITRKAVRALPI